MTRVNSILLDLKNVSLELSHFYYFYRQQDVRATEIDKVDMHSSFRPGDIVKAVVVSSMLKFTSSHFSCK